MKIQDLLRKDVMLLDLQATEKTAVIEEMIKSLVDHGYVTDFETCLLYTSPSPRDRSVSRMPSSA